MRLGGSGPGLGAPAPAAVHLADQRSWQFDPDPDHASEIEASFRPDGSGTVVEVEHRLFERLAGGQAINDAINGGGGWALLLDGYAKAVAEQ